MITNFRISYLIVLLFIAFAVASCKKDDEAPEPENDNEIITDVTLIFTPTDGSGVVKAIAKDPDGSGIGVINIQQEPTLKAGTTYTLTYEIFNNSEDEGEDIGAEILVEDHEHQFFFSFTDGAFSNPTGNGNIDNASDPINYNDKDDNDNPVGLKTTWTTAEKTLTDGSFRVILQHQPDVKTATSSVKDGSADFDLTFKLNIEE